MSRAEDDILDVFARSLVDQLGLPRSPQEHRARDPRTHQQAIRCDGCGGSVTFPQGEVVPLEVMQAACSCQTLGTFRFQVTAP